MNHPETYGRYQIKRVIGQGGMATVYLAHDPRFGRDVALKAVSLAYKDDPTFRSRFEREARTIATLEHPAIVPVYDFGEDNDQLFLVMRLMKGGSLSDRIISGPLSVEDALPIVERIAQALDHAHQRGVIHRDLKPGNVLFDEYNRAFLSDFGIVKLAAEATHTDLTGSGVIGTPAYMSPEQIHGDIDLDGRSDIYTLGIILFEMLTGIKPYRAETPVKQMMAHIMNPIPNIRSLRPELPPGTETVIEKALAKERVERYSSGEALTADLTFTATGTKLPPILDYVPPPIDRQAETAVNPAVSLPQDPPTLVSETDPTPPRLPRLPQDPPAKRRWPVWALALAFLAMVAVLLFVLNGLLPDDTPQETGEATAVVTATQAADPTPAVTKTVPGSSSGEGGVPTAVASPESNLAQIGESVNGVPIEAHRFGNGSTVVLLVGGIHAGKVPGSVLLADALIAYFDSNEELIPTNVTVWIVSNLNPDSPTAPGETIGRLNANGVDLNRNWDCAWQETPLFNDVPLQGAGGTAPFSEPEVQALRDFILEVQPQAIVFWQARSNGGLVSPGDCGSAPQVSQPLANVYGTAAGYQIADFEQISGQIINGDSTNWLDMQGFPAISVLAPTNEEPDFEANLAGVLAVLQQLSDG